MTTPTEEERKAAAEEVNKRAGINPIGSVAIDLQVQLTRTEKRLEEAEGLLRRYIKAHIGEQGCCVDRFGKIKVDSRCEICKDADAILNPPAEGE